jgi:hypothetical protein
MAKNLVFLRKKKLFSVEGYKYFFHPTIIIQEILISQTLYTNGNGNNCKKKEEDNYMIISQ